MSADTARKNRSRRVMPVLVACALAAGLLAVFPQVAKANPLEEMASIQASIQESNAAFEEATARVDELQALIDENTAHVAQIESELPVLRDRAADSMRILYKMQQGVGGLIELILSADDFNELITTVQYLDVIQSHNNDAVWGLVAKAEELEATRAELDQQMAEAETARKEAADALAEAQAARAELQAQIDAQAAAEAAERQAALEQAEEEAGQKFETETGGEADVEVPSNPDPDPVAPSDSKESFVSTWAPRIDSFLAGSPLAGQGTTFAEAAWAYGADPRFSPAISAVESSRGLYCFRPYNAWGWGNVSWGSWEEAIWAHVAGLASGYGGQLTYAGAQKYCPPNAAAWYSSVLANMERI